MSPTTRSLKLLRSEGYLVEVVERWIPGAGIRRDLFGFCDLLAVHVGQVIFVQTTSYSGLSARVKKIRAEPRAARVLDCGFKIEVHGWKQTTGSKRWFCRRVDIDLTGDMKELAARPRVRRKRKRKEEYAELWQ